MGEFQRYALYIDSLRGEAAADLLAGCKPLSEPELSTTEPCTACKQTGFVVVRGALVPCRRCDGRGVVE